MTTSCEEIIHGVPIGDRYRWLEDRSLPETSAWIYEQQRACNAYFNECSELPLLERRVRDYLDIVVIDQPTRVGDRYFYRKRDQGQEQACLCVRDLATNEERILVDPSADGQYASVGLYRIAQDGTYVAYELGRGGEDRKEIRIVELKTASVLPDYIPSGYPRGFAFAQDGYFYVHEIEDQSDAHEIRYHRFASAGTDIPVLRIPRRPGSRLLLKADQQRLGAIYHRPESNDIVSDFFIADLSGTPRWSSVFRNKRGRYFPILSHGHILALTETESKSFRLVRIAKDGHELQTIVPETELYLGQLAITRKSIWVNRQKCGVPSIDCWSWKGQQLPSLNLPAQGAVKIFPNNGPDAETFFYSVESFDTPPTIYERAVGAKASTPWQSTNSRFRSKRFAIQQASFLSRDRTAIPLTLVFDGRRRLPGPRPVIMTSYGGFGAQMTPTFCVLANLMIEFGAIFVLPHIRGGGELGKAWHEAGRARNRQAAFDDFIAAAEWLCQQGLTNPKRLAIFGGSNAGLLVGAAMTQRADLFRAVLCMVPLLDMIRYESFDRALTWRREYGTVEDPDDFRALYAYSPYHHVQQDINYPATMFVTGDKDDRCSPAHVRKMAALLQNRPAQKEPVIVDYDHERGHSPVLPLSTRIAALCRRIAFLCRELQIVVPQGDAR
jgi:prolyl oligopeptidase